MKTLLPFGLALMLSAPTIAGDWTLDREASTVTIETTAFGSGVSGEFTSFEADIRFNPDNLADASIVGRIRVESGDTGNAQYNSEMVSEDGLDAENHPFAAFESDGVSISNECETGNGSCYVATGHLTLRNSTQPAELVFDLRIEGDRAIANGQLNLSRDDFGIGGGNWGNSARTVVVNLHIEATR